MDLDTFTRLRTHAYHLTERLNLARIMRTGCLEAASSLYLKAGCSGRITQRRSAHDVIQVNGESVHVRDQSPLKQGNIDLTTTSFNDVIRTLNNHVFFWPGDHRRPILSGRNHFGRYSSSDCVVFVIQTRNIFNANTARPKFSACNSGAPRMQQGRKQPRDSQTFRYAHDFQRNPGEVIEVVFEEKAVLPQTDFEIRELREIDLG